MLKMRLFECFHTLCSFKAFGLVAMNFVWYEFYDHYGYHCQGSESFSMQLRSSKVDKLSNMADTEEIVTVTEPSRPPTAGSIKETTGETSSRPASSALR